MSRISNILLEKEILLESGTNELEILVFRLGDYTFGINVAKVREVLPRGPITSLPQAHASVLGVFRLREAVVPVVSLRRHLQIAMGEAGSDQTLILADFNQQQTAFVVDAVERIHRISWEQILAVPAISSLAHSPVTAVARIDGRLVIMLDFEMITDQVTEQLFRTGAVANPLNLARHKLKILLADDSPTVREAVTKTLRSSGYTQLTVFENGREAWEWLIAQVGPQTQRAQIADLLISDVEMPQIDGLHLTKRIKDHPVLKSLPVLLYSSIVTPDNRKKGEAVGADAQISKPELGKVVEIADGLIAGAQPLVESETSETNISRAASVSLQNWLTPPGSLVAAATLQIQDEQAPPWPTEDDETTPAESNPRVWQAFRAELSDHSRRLQKVVQASESGVPHEDNRQDAMRVLHTIKSAAMVVPANEVARLTHAIESLLEPERVATQGWPSESLTSFVAWLQRLAAPGAPLAALFAEGRAQFERLSLNV